MESPRSDAALSFPAEPDVPEPGLDARWERDLILLLSKLEQGRSYLAEPTTRRQPALALHATVAMLDEVIRFAERRRIDEPDANADAVLSRAGELVAAAHELFKEVNPSGMQSFLSFFRRPSGDGAQHRNALQRVVRGLPAVLEGFFGLWEGQFQSPAAGKDWVQVYRVFLDDLNFVIDAF
jgi:hypothetical protein